MPPSSGTMMDDDSEPASNSSTTISAGHGGKPQQHRQTMHSPFDAVETDAGSTASSAGSTGSRIRRRAVHWGVARIYPITPLSEFTATQTRVTWFQASEYAEMSKENMRLIDQLMKFGNVVGESAGKVTSRGLEHMTEEEIRRRKRLRDEALDAVLDEQDRQYEEDHRPTPTPEGISAVYAPIASRAYRIAQRIGQQDERVAKAIVEPADAEEAKISAASLGRRCSRVKQKVRFSPMVHVQPVLHLTEYTPEEAKLTWFVEKDIQLFKLQSKRLIKSLLKSKIVLPDLEVDEPALDSSSREEVSSPTNANVCIRGLEPYLLGSKIGTRKENVSNTWNAVLDEQDRQDSIRQYLPAHLAQASRDSSSKCIKVARRLARQDEQFVIRHLSEELQRWGVALGEKASGSAAIDSNSQTNKCAAPLSRRGSASSCSSTGSSIPPRIHRDYRRDSLSVAGAASKVAATSSNDDDDIPDCITTSNASETPSNGRLKDALASLNPPQVTPLPHDYRQDSLTLMPLPWAVSEELEVPDDMENGNLLEPPSPTISESSSSYDASPSNGFSDLKAMASVAGPVRDGRRMLDPE